MRYITGFHAIEEWLLSGREAEALLIAKPGPRARKLMDMAAARNIRLDRVGSAELDRIASDHRGIALSLVAANEKGETRLEDFLAGLESRDALVVVLDEITDPHNYGAILRCCDQFGVDLVITRRRRVAKHSDVIGKTSAGASAWVPVALEPNLVRALESLAAAGLWIYGADMSGEAAYRKDMRGRSVLVLGGEGTGLSRLLRDHCDALVAIPRLGRLDSLNVSVAAGVLLYEARRQQDTKPTKA
jgi:23S rRNA (guanosine2251-2'-O)-methyltransferase